MMGISVEEYDKTPALTIDWDFEMMRVEERAQEALRDR